MQDLQFYIDVDCYNGKIYNDLILKDLFMIRSIK